MNAAETPKYRKLPGRGREGKIVTTGGVKKGYLGEDHLLCLETHMFMENYKRFYYRDIQAIIVARLSYLRPIFVVGLIVFGVLLASVLAVRDDVARVSLAIASGLMGLLILVDLLRGRPCITVLRTAVQSETLSFMSRMPNARKCLALLVPLIEAAQTTPQPVAAPPEPPPRVEPAADPGPPPVI